MIDFHSHFLPNIDDGAKSYEISIEYIEKLHHLGFNKFLLTPHIYPELYDNNREIILEKFEQFKKSIDKYFKGKIEIFPGSEVYLSEDTVESILNNDVLTINDKKKYVLFEVDFTFLPPNLDELIAKIKKNGIFLIWAHPERNAEIIKNPEILGKFIDQDVLIQVNLGSFAGQFGEEIEHTAKKLLKMNMVHLIGSDCHCSQRRRFVYEEAINYIKEHALKNYVDYIFEKNAEKILNGNIVYPFQYIVENKTFFGKLKKFFKID